MYMCGAVEVKLHAFVTLVLVGGEWSASSHGPSIAGGEAPVPTG
jgi:hypothetical protein